MVDLPLTDAARKYVTRTDLQNAHDVDGTGVAYRLDADPLYPNTARYLTITPTGEFETLLTNTLGPDGKHRTRESLDDTAMAVANNARRKS